MQERNWGSLLRLALPMFGLAFGIIIGTMFFVLTEEDWLIATGIGIGLVIFSIIGTYLEMRKPVTHEDRITSYSRRTLFAVFKA